MTSPESRARLAHDDLASPQQMFVDARAAGTNLRLDGVAAAAVKPAPSLHFEDFPREVAKRDIRIDEAATRIANALHLHLD